MTLNDTSTGPEEAPEGLDADAAPAVHIQNGRVLANSRSVAEYFGKRHDNVLRDIDALIEQAPACSLNFEEGSYTLPNTGPQRHRCFDMDRDGFTLLAMGFTGSRALQFKLQYIRAFNAMEAELRNRKPPLPDFSDPAEAARAWALEYEKAKRLASIRSHYSPTKPPSGAFIAV